MIEVEGLTRWFGGRCVVGDLTLRVQKGQMIGLLGRNGAGKTTVLRLLAGVLMPDAGIVRIDGHDLARAPRLARRRLGYLPEGAPLYGHVTVQALLLYLARLRGLRRAQLVRRYEETVLALDIEPVLARPVASLTRGQRCRVGIAQAILHDPPVLLLDEPGDGLDPGEQASVRALLRSLSRDRAIVVATQRLDDMVPQCTRLGLLSRGRLVLDDTPGGLRARSRYRGAVSFSAVAAGPARAALGLLPEVDTIEVDPCSGRVTVLSKPGRELLPKVQALLANYGVQPSELTLEPGRLEDVFNSLTEADAALEGEA